MRPCTLFGTLLLVLTLPVFAQGAESETKSIVAVSAEVDSVFDPLLEPEPRGWLGADGAVSVPIDDKKTLWLFGDTLVGTMTPEGKRSGTMPRNTLGVQDFSNGLPGKIEYYWDLTDNVPGDFFSIDRRDPSEWYWPGTGVRVGNELILFLYHVAQAEGNDAFSFSLKGLTLFRVKNPLACPCEWRMERADLGMVSSDYGFGTAALVEGEWVYLLGYLDGRDKEKPTRETVVARAKLQDLNTNPSESAFEYWSQSGGEGAWKGDPADLKPLFSPGATESSLQYHAATGRYIAVTHHAFQPGMYLVTAPQITGPWSEPVRIYDVPQMAEDKNLHAYAMKSHPELVTSPDELLLTYVVNTSDFWSMFNNPKIYYPRFVRVKLKTD